MVEVKGKVGEGRASDEPVRVPSSRYHAFMVRDGASVLILDECAYALGPFTTVDPS